MRSTASSRGPSSSAPAEPSEVNTASAIILRAAAIDGSLAVSHTNSGNLPFARNWYRHLLRAGVSNFALIATDDVAYDRMRAELPGRVVRCPTAIYSDSERQGPQRFRSAGWTRLMFAVPRMVHWVVQLGLGVLWMDTDVVALANPFPFLGGLLEGNASVALLASVDGRFPPEKPGECAQMYTHEARWGRSAGTSKLCGGLFYLRPGAPTLAFLRAWERRLHGAKAGAKNQPHYNEALRAVGLPLRLLPCDLFPNGYRYASEAWRAAQRRRPLLVHNNWIVGHDAKLQRFRSWRMWLAGSELDGDKLAAAT